MGFPSFGGSIMFGIIPVIVAIGFVFVFGTIIVRLIKGANQWKRNNDHSMWRAYPPN